MSSEIEKVLAIIDEWMDGYDHTGTGDSRSARLSEREWAEDRARIVALLTPPSSATPGEVERLRELALCMYIGPGAVHDMPEHWLDALCAAGHGEPFSCDALLPYTGPSATPGECQHDWVRDEEAVTYHCCQKCGAVKRDTPQPASPAVNGSVASALSDEPRFNRVAAAIAKAPQPQERAGSEAGGCDCCGANPDVCDACEEAITRPQPASDASGEELAARLDRAAGIRSDGEAKLMLDAAEMIRTLSRALAESRAGSGEEV